MRKKVLIIGGLAQSLINFRWPLIKAIANRGYEVHGCAADNNERVSKLFLDIGGKYHVFHLKRTGSNPADDIRTLFELWRLIGKIKPEYVICYTIKPVVYGILASWIRRVPYRYALITGLGYAFTQSKEGRTRSWIQSTSKTLYKQALQRTEHVFFQNPDDQNFFKNSGILKSEQKSSIVNGSGVDTQHFHVAPLPPNPVFLLIARLLRDKGILEYVEAAKIVKSRGVDATFLLVGPFDVNPSAITSDQVDDWQKSKIIHYLGTVDDVRQVIRESSIYVLPSYREGTPRSVLEAMAMGRPVITTDAPGCRETVVNGTNGFLVQPQDPISLAEAMLHLALDPDLREKFGQESRKIACQKYDANSVSFALLESTKIVPQNR
ncbi:glycosyltransferase family 4 protein [Pigmentiphaga sp. CHJ604]|uniref:glycosyltransferase family 4 protein n=1 Tax=Pigmentiphaga sp. CHJ604 TaxID=3081984 RepID=UPI0030D61F51